MNMVKKLSASTPQLTGFPIDPVIVGISVFLMLYGLVMIGSASLEVGVKTYGNPFFLLTRHSIYLMVSGLAALIAISVPIQRWQKYDATLLGVSFLLLIVVLVPGIGKEVNGATRWVALGPFSLQGSEFVKLFVIIYMAGYMVRRKEEIETSPLGFTKPLVVLTLIVFLLLEQPDFGAAIVIISAVLGMIFLAGVSSCLWLRLVVPLSRSLRHCSLIGSLG
jgi:cell division protein FtsW